MAREESTAVVAAQPDLSVIIPAFNADDFVERCLQSVIEQTDVSLEVIVVDDGSTDSTKSRVEAFAAKDPRVEVLSGENAGPAHARNRGVSRAKGKYLAFVDADDEVLPGAFARLVGSLEATGSDLATGSYVRLGTMGRIRPKLTARVHARERLAVGLADMPELLEEPVLWNKIYRREFWQRHIGLMTDFANYEDQEPVYRALNAAHAIDVLTEDVYGWRLAEGRVTRSRRKGRRADLKARLAVIESLERALRTAPDAVREYAYSVWMGTDLAMHADYYDTASKAFRHLLSSAASGLKDRMPRASWKRIPAQARLLMWVVSTGRLDDVEEILGTRLEDTTAVPLEHRDDRWWVNPSYVPRLRTRIPERLLRAQPVDFTPQCRVRNVQWIGPRSVELRGCAYIPGVDPSTTGVRLRGVMDGAVVVDEAVECVNDAQIDLEVGDPWRSYEAAGFIVRLDLSGMDDVSPRGIQLIADFTADDLHLDCPATAQTVVGMIAPSPIVDGCRLTVVADEHDDLSLSPVAVPTGSAIAKSVSIRGSDVTVSLTRDQAVTGLELIHGGRAHPLSADGPLLFSGRVPEMPERYAAGGERTWSIQAVTTGGARLPLLHAEIDYLLPSSGHVRLRANAAGKVQLSQRWMRVSIDGAGSDRDRLLLTGRIDPPQKQAVALRSSDRTIVPEDFVMHADGAFTAVYDLTTVGPEGRRIAAMSGGFHVRYGATPESADGWARVAGKLAIRPVDCFTEWNTLRLEGRRSGAVAIMASAPLNAEERTKYGQFQLRERDWGEISEGIVFESFSGKNTVDNPRALFEEIRESGTDEPLYWSVKDRRVEVPEGGIPVVEGTAAWHRALAISRVWINNNNFPYYVRKRPGQYYLQTWHGTPIKKLLWDIPRRNVPLTYRRLMRTEVAQWDLLLAQSEEAAVNLRSGLGYDGPVEVAEYPRNRRLFEGLANPGPIRDRLGIGNDEKVILYVPTWRDSHRNGRVMQWNDYLDPEALARETGARVLVRAHHMTKSRTIDAPGVLDVSKEPFIEDLMAIADVLVTDYSSAAVDFELTGRKVVYFSLDGPEYSTSRGFYGAPWHHSRFEDLCESEKSLHIKVSNNLSESSLLDSSSPSSHPAPVYVKYSESTLRNNVPDSCNGPNMTQRRGTHE